MSQRDPHPDQLEKRVREYSEPAVSDPFERQALLLLWIAGWNVETLAMTFQCSTDSVRGVLAEFGGGHN